MPSGHASHKGMSNKPNTNAPGVVDEAADQTVAPETLLDEDVMPYTTRTDEALEPEAAVEEAERKSEG